MPIWAITIPELNVYEQREVRDTKHAQASAVVIAMQHGCTPHTAAPWQCGTPWSYRRKVRLPDVVIPEREPHGVIEAIRCRLKRRCAHCDDKVRMLDFAGGESLEVHMALPVRLPGRRTLLERNRLGEFGTLEVALVFDLMMGVKPDPQAVADWEAAGGANAPGANAARETALYEKS